MNPLVALTVVIILIATPAAVGATRFMWRLYAEDRSTSTDPERISLSLVLAVVVTLVTVAGVILAIPTILFLVGARVPGAGTAILVAIDILLPAPVAIAVYLRWRRGPYR